jgi:hypothetical protein
LSLHGRKASTPQIGIGNVVVLIFIEHPLQPLVASTIST